MALSIKKLYNLKQKIGMRVELNAFYVLKKYTV